MATVNIKKQDGSYERVADTQGVLIPQDLRFCSMFRRDVLGGGQGWQMSTTYLQYPLLWNTDAKASGEDWTNGNNITVPETGLYLISYNGTYGMSTQEGVRRTAVYVNGVIYAPGGLRVNCHDVNWNGFSHSFTVRLNKGDNLGLWASTEGATTLLATIWEAWLRATLLQKTAPYIIANKGALVSGGAFQFDADGNGYTENYSTDEIRVGTWVDGKPIYKRTFSRRFTTPGVDTAVILDDRPIFKFLVKYEITFYMDTNTENPTQGDWSSSDNRYLISSDPARRAYIIEVLTYGYILKAMRNIIDERYLNGTYYITAWYTKTTD
jgi:hypothetical protein